MYLRNLLFLCFGFIIASAILFWSICCCDLREMFNNVLIGIVSSLFLLIVLELRTWLNDLNQFGHLHGTYKRTKMFMIDHAATADTKYRPWLEYDNVDSHVEIKYHGSRKYTLTAKYAEGDVKGSFNLKEFTPTIANGTYQYVNKTYPDIGTYEIFIDESNSKVLHVFHKNIVPSGIADGYEIWEKQ